MSLLTMLLASSKSAVDGVTGARMTAEVNTSALSSKEASAGVTGPSTEKSLTKRVSSNVASAGVDGANAMQ